MTISSAITILLIEDDIIDVKYLKTEFTAHNIQNTLIVAGNGIEALDKLYGRNNQCRINPDLIILDVSMPKMGGLEFIKTIRSDPQFANLPVCILSSSNAERDIEAAQKLGVTAYFLKPLDFEKFLPVFNHILEQV